MPEHNLLSVKMSRSVKKQSEKVKEKVDFKLQFHATRLPPTGWDRLVVSLIPVDTGRTSSKTQKAYVRNGICQWPEAVIESTMLAVDQKSKEYEEKLYRLVISMALSRAGVLGEVVVNLADHVAAYSPAALALPLKNCSYGTILHIKIQCLTHTPSSREFEAQREVSLDYADDSSDVDDNIDSPGSQQRNGSFTAPRDTDAVGSMPRKSSDSHEVSLTSRSRGLNGNNRLPALGDYSSPTSSISSISDRQEQNGQSRTGSLDSNSAFSSFQKSARTAPIKRQNSNKKLDEVSMPASVGVAEDAPFTGSQGSFEDAVRATNHKETAHLNHGYFQADSDAVERAIDEQRLEAKRWESHARKCKMEVDTLKQQLSEHVKQLAHRTTELSALVAERDSIKTELHELKDEKHLWEGKANSDDNNGWKAEDSKQIIKELKQELAFEKETNLNLNLQIQKIQDSNMELVSAIQELEESLEEQRKEMEELSSKNNQLESSLQTAICQQQHAETSSENDSISKDLKLMGEYLPNSQPTVESLMKEIAVLERDITELTDENMDLIFNINKTKQEAASQNATIDQLQEKLKKLSSMQLSDTPNADSQLDGLTSLTTVHFKSLKDGNRESETESALNLHTVTQLKVNIANLESENAAFLQEKEQMEYDINNLKETLESKLQCSQEKERLNVSRFKQLAHQLSVFANQTKSSILSEISFDAIIEQAEQEKSELQQALKLSQEGKTAKDSASSLANDLAALTAQLHLFAEAKGNLDKWIYQMEIAKTHLQEQVARSEYRNLQSIDSNEVLQEHISFADESETSKSGKNLIGSLILELRKEKEELEMKHHNFVNQLEEKCAEVERKKLEVENECDMYKEEKFHLETQIMNLQSEVAGQQKVKLSLEERIELLQRLNIDMEEYVQSLKKDHSAAIAEKVSVDVELCYLRKDIDAKEGKYLEEMETLKWSKSEEEKRTSKVKASLRRTRWKAAIAIERLQSEVQQLREKLRATRVDGENYVLMDAMSEAQSNVKEKDDEIKSIAEDTFVLPRPLSTSNSVIGPLSTASQSQAESDLLEKVKLLEAEIRIKALELGSLKHEFTEKEMVLCEKIEYLEMANEQLAEGQEDSALEQLQNELTRLQNQNSLLLKHEQELFSKLSTQELLQSEVQRLQEENEQLDCKLSKLVETMKSGDFLERIVQLETELSDALEANNMYKSQLRSAFSQQHNVHVAALQNLGDIDQVISDLAAYKKQTMVLEEDLKEMRDRYFSMSLKYAEVEAQREELVISIRTLRNGQKR